MILDFKRMEIVRGNQQLLLFWSLKQL